MMVRIYGRFCLLLTPVKLHVLFNVKRGNIASVRIFRKAVLIKIYDFVLPFQGHSMQLEQSI